MQNISRTPRAVFVVGVPRSGTTWLLTLLARHPEVAAVQQAALFETLEPLRSWWESHGGYGKRIISSSTSSKLKPQVLEDTYLGDRLRLEDFDRLCKPIVLHVLTAVSQASDGARVVVLHTPENIRYWPLILRLLPDAVFLHVVRDPRAVLASQRAATKTWAAGQLSADAEAVAHQWDSAMNTAIELRRAGTRYLEIHYEQLRRSPEETLARVFEELGLAASAEFISKAIDDCSLESLQRARIGPQGFVRTGLIDGWRSELSSSQVHCIEYLLAPQMRAHGYAPVIRSFHKKPWRLRRRRAVRLVLSPLLSPRSPIIRFARHLMALLYLPVF